MHQVFEDMSLGTLDIDLACDHMLSVEYTTRMNTISLLIQNYQ
jgi:hypothetical protein